MTYYRTRYSSYDHWFRPLIFGVIMFSLISTLYNNHIKSSIKVGKNPVTYKINNLRQRNLLTNCKKTEKLRYLEKEKDWMLDKITHIDKTISSLQDTKQMYHLNKNDTRIKLKGIIHYHTGIPMHNINLDKIEDILKLSQWINIEDARNILIDVQDVFLVDIYKYKMIHVELLLELLYDIDHIMEMRQQLINKKIQTKPDNKTL